MRPLPARIRRRRRAAPPSCGPQARVTEGLAAGSLAAARASLPAPAPTREMALAVAAAGCALFRGQPRAGGADQAGAREAQPGRREAGARLAAAAAAFAGAASAAASGDLCPILLSWAAASTLMTAVQ